MTELTSLLGTELIVSFDPRQVDRQFAAFAGADGLTGISLGTRGHAIFVTGVIRVAAPTYDAGRSNASTVIQNLESLQYLTEDDYHFKGSYFYNVIFVKLILIKDRNGKIFTWTANSQVLVKFVYHLRSLA